jgi:hypothetical protein
MPVATLQQRQPFAIPSRVPATRETSRRRRIDPIAVGLSSLSITQGPTPEN